MSNETVRIGVVGAGDATRSGHIPKFRAIEGVEVVGVVNRSRQSSQRVADELGIPTVYENWRDLVADPDIDAVFIGTWPHMHRPVVLGALEHDKHVLTEARFARNAREARDMAEAALGKPHLVAQVVPWDPLGPELVRKIKDLIANGYTGDLLSVDLTVQGGFLDRDAPYGWRKDRDISGYNTMMLGGWYECLIRLVGHASSVTAVTRVSVPIRLDETGEPQFVDIPDLVEVLYEIASGPVVHLRVSEVSGLAPPDQLWFFGADGTLQIKFGGDGEVTMVYGGRRGDAGLSEIVEGPGEHETRREEQEFINAIRGVEQVTHTTFADGVRYMEFTEAVTRSAQRRETVFLPL